MVFFMGYVDQCRKYISYSYNSTTSNADGGLAGSSYFLCLSCPIAFIIWLGYSMLAELSSILRFTYLLVLRGACTPRPRTKHIHSRFLLPCRIRNIFLQFDQVLTVSYMTCMEDCRRDWSYVFCSFKCTCHIVAFWSIATEALRHIQILHTYDIWKMLDKTHIGLT